ncbi:nitrous oxide reductase family maturation protein NosD [Pseudomonas profundi]|uniref:nitrous oxide reductase family maturation protein NosD n=1 Tax=Pseudomonas profundi TaxID=1981513 RepID=UPI001CC23872|nr:nitrous oxide reductase family maturation protein NosD [Pseudomonas profundi]
MPKKPARVVTRLSALCALLYFSGVAQAAPQSITDLPLSADSDNRWSLPAGEYQGQFLIDQPIHLRCEDGAILNGQGTGHVVEIKTPDVTLENCTLSDWGQNLTELDAGIFLHPEADRATLRGNRLRGPGFGIWIDQASDVSVVGNDIQGDQSMRSQNRGNGIHLFSTKGTRIIDNHVRHTRDGVYIGNSNGNQIEGNTLEDLRYGVHYMFSHDNTVIGNITRNTRTGYALMQSRQLTVTGNRSEHDQNYGILMNYITYSTISGNFVSDAHQGDTGDSMISGAEGKALFIYNSLFNTIENNHFENSGLGIHLTAGSEDNKISRNAFVANQQQVKYVATRTQEWSVDGQGNYWSDYLGWDRDNDGLGDVAYEPNDNIDRLLWLYPQVRLLMNSPAIELLRWVQRVFPVTKSPGVQDSHPLMKLPADSPALAQETTR